MSPGAEGAILALVAHARQVPAVERERFAARLRDKHAGRAVVLETCHRVEGYLVRPDNPDRLRRELSLPPGGASLMTEDAVRHAIAVAVGRDSVVIGEDQILHQLRESIETARTAGTLDPVLERLFALALQAGRRARSWRQGPQRSLADVALSVIERQGGPLRGRAVLVVGAGRMGGLAARAAVAAGASVSVANRSPESAQSLALATGARVAAFDPGAPVSEFGAVMVALGGPWPIAEITINALVASAAIVVDLSVPASVPEALPEALGSRFASADTLALADPDPTTRQDGSRARVDALVERTTIEFLHWLKGRDGRAIANALVKHADQEREAELAALWRRLPDLPPETRGAIEEMTRHLAARLLREPLERLGRDIDGRDERAVRDLFAL